MSAPSILLIGALLPVLASGAANESGAALASAASGPQATSSAGAALAAQDLEVGFTGQVPEAEEWARWLARDRRAAFSLGSVEAALAVLEGEADEVARAAALIALGAGGKALHQTLLERAAGEGAALERCAATLALASCGPSARRGLRTLYGASDEQQRECALLALVLVDPDARELAHQVASKNGAPLPGGAAEFWLFAREPASSGPTRATALLLELRWQAALRFGTIDGAALAVLRARALLDDEAFVRDVVLGIAEVVRRPGAADHVLTELLEGTGMSRLRAAVACIPEELSQVVQYGFFEPSGAQEWNVLLDEIDRRGTAYRTIGLLHAALEVPEVRWRALALLAPLGDAQGRTALAGDLEGLSSADLCLACDAMGSTGDRGWTTRLEELTRRDDAALRTSALVARVRLGSDDARDALLFTFEEAGHPDRAAALEAMRRNARDPRVASWLMRLLRDAEGDEAFAIATSLAALGNPLGRERLLEALAQTPPRGALGARAVRALGEARDGDEVRGLRALYPVAGEHEVNVALAQVLIRARDLDALPVVRRALWDASFDVSVLAGGLAAELFSVRILVDELSRPPPQATSADIRRVGFAIGEWGGLEEVDHLAKQLRFNSGNPALQGALLGALTHRTR